MKKLITTIALVAVSLVSFAQSDSVTVSREVDDMTDKVSWYANVILVAANEGKTKGITIQPSIANGSSINTLIVSPVGLGNCNEDNTLIIKFVDGSKVKLSSWNKFDCEVAYFAPTSALVTKLKAVEIDKIYFQNGRTFDSGTFPVSRPRYFIQLYKGL